MNSEQLQQMLSDGLHPPRSGGRVVLFMGLPESSVLLAADRKAWLETLGANLLQSIFIDLLVCLCRDKFFQSKKIA